MTRMLDPRVKVVVLLFVNLLMYSSIAYWVEALCVLAITLALLYQQQYKDAAISLTGYAIIAALTFLMVIIGGKMSTAIGAFLLLIRKMFPVFMAANYLRLAKMALSQSADCKHYSHSSFLPNDCGGI